MPREPPGMTKMLVFTHPLVSTAVLLAGFFLVAISICQSPCGIARSASSLYGIYAAGRRTVSNSYADDLNWCGRVAVFPARRGQVIKMIGSRTRFGLPSTVGRRSMPIEYFVLANIRSEGPVVGRLADQPIRETVVDDRGIRYRYAGLAPRDPDGRFDVNCLRAGEWIVRPGFIYVSDDPSGQRL